MSEQWHYEQKGESYIKVDTLHKIRTLETELAAAREELADWHNAAEQVKAEYPDEVHCSCVAILRKQLKDVTEQRDRLAEACSPFFDTTETDAAWSAHCIDPDSASGNPWYLAKKLETELAAVTEQLKAAQEEIVKLTKGWADCVLRCSKAEDQRDKLANLVKQFIYILDITEESDGGRLYHPTNITSCRAGDLQKAGELVEALRRAVKGGSDE